MRHYRDARAIASALIEEFTSAGYRVADRDGVRYAMFVSDIDGTPIPVLIIDIDRLATDLERRLS